MASPGQTFTVAFFIESFIIDLGLSRTTLTLIYGAATLSASLMLPFMGKLIDRYGPRRMTLLIAFGLGIVTIGMSQVQGTFTIFLGFFAIRFLGFGSLRLASNNLIAQWFIRKRGRAMGFAGLSLAISLAVFPRLSETLINLFEWRNAWVVLGLLVWVIVLPAGWALFKDRPELYGVLPDGDTQNLSDSQQSSVDEENWTLAEARRTGAFWILLVALSIITMILAGLVFHHPSLFAERDFSRQQSVMVFNIIAIFIVLGNLIMGWLLDRFSARLLVGAILTMLVATLLLVQTMTTVGQAFLYGVFVGLTSGAFRVMDGVVWAKYFGRLHLGSIRGAALIGVVGSTALGPYPLGASLDYFGSYTPALTGLIILPVGIGLILPFVKRPYKKSHT
ncbi:MAG: MFS transporter [Chloroflexota bacterium]